MGCIQITDGVVLFDNEMLAEGAKPCPFCGNTYIKTRTKEWYEDSKVHGMSFECSKCDTEKWYFPPLNERHEYTKVNYEDVLKNLLDGWNTRSECAAHGTADTEEDT